MPVKASLTREALPPPILPAVIGTGLLFGGLDNALGKSLVCLAAVLMLCWQLWYNPPSRTIIRALLPVLSLIGCAAIWAWWTSVASGLPGTPHALTPDLAMHGLVGMIGNTLIFTLATLVGYRRRSLEGDVDWLIAFLAIGLFIGVLLYFTDTAATFAFWDRTYGPRFMGTLNNANVAANVYAVLALLAFCRLLVIRAPGRFRHERRSDRVRFWLSAISLPAALAAIVATGSRTTIVTVAAISVLLMAVRAARTRGHRQRRSALALAGAMLLLAALATPLAAIVNSRFSVMQAGASGRWLLWSHYAEIAFASPWRGYGLGSFPTVNVRYPGPVEVAQQLWMVNSPHNFLLHLLIEAGWPLVATCVMAAGLVGWTLTTAVLRGWLRLDIAGLLASAAIVLTGSMVDIVLEVPAPTALFLLIVGLCFGQATRARMLWSR